MNYFTDLERTIQRRDHVDLLRLLQWNATHMDESFENDIYAYTLTLEGLVSERNEDCLKVIRAMGYDLSIAFKKALATNDEAYIQFFVDELSVDVNECFVIDIPGWIEIRISPLCEAYRTRSFGAIRVLLQNGATCVTSTDDGVTLKYMEKECKDIFRRHASPDALSNLHRDHNVRIHSNQEYEDSMIVTFPKFPQVLIHDIVTKYL